MNKATALFAITTVTSSVIALYLGWTLHVERARFAAADGAAAPMSASTSIPQPRPPSTVSSNPEAVPANGGAAPPTPGKQTSPVSVSSEPSRQVALPSRVRNRSHASADLAYRRLELQKQYPDLTAVLNLQADEAARFFNLLAQQEVNDAEWEMSSEGSGKSSQRELQRRWQANKAEQAALLGDARVADWNKYLNSLGARAEVRELRILLANSDYLLRRDQYEPLVALLAPEQIRHNDEREQLRRAQGDATNQTPEQVIKYMDRRMDLIEESLARRRRAAATVLDTEQLRHYQTMLDLQRLQSQVEYDSFVTLNAEAAQDKARAAR